RGAVDEDVRARGLVEADDVRLAAATLHFVERPELCRVRVQPRLDVLPFDAAVTRAVCLETGLEGRQQGLLLGARQTPSRRLAARGCRLTLGGPLHPVVDC